MHDQPVYEIEVPKTHNLVANGFAVHDGTDPADPTEPIRRQRQAEINVVPGSREALEAKYGQVWTTDEMRAEFVAMGFRAPLCIVRRRADCQVGSLEFQHDPRLYFNWQPHDE